MDLLSLRIAIEMHRNASAWLRPGLRAGARRSDIETLRKNNVLSAADNLLLRLSRFTLHCLYPLVEKRHRPFNAVARNYVNSLHRAIEHRRKRV